MLAAHGLNALIAQANVAWNPRAATLRGMHFQYPPAAETKLVRCTRGAIFDVALDLRRDSPTFKQHLSAVLTAENRTMLYVPEGVGHGFQTLEDDTDLCYQISTAYHPEAARGVRPEDPALAIPWPLPQTRMPRSASPRATASATRRASWMSWPAQQAPLRCVAAP